MFDLLLHINHILFAVF